MNSLFRNNSRSPSKSSSSSQHDQEINWNTLAITKFSENLNNKYIEKIKEYFTESQQQLFLMNFYSYLNFDSENDYVINLEDIWEWLGYSRKEECKRVLKKHFTTDTDYTINFAPQVGGAKNNSKEVRGGHNKELIMLNVDTFKNLCLVCNTHQGKEIRKYYIKLEKIFNDITIESIKENDEKRRLEYEEYKKENELLLQENAKLKQRKPVFLEQEFDQIVYVIPLETEDAYKVGMNCSTQILYYLVLYNNV